MPRWDVTDRTVIRAPAPAVFRAVLDAYSGRAPWWLPQLRAVPRPGAPASSEGLVTDVFVRGRGPSRFTARISEVIEAKKIGLDYIGGDFIGHAAWTFEPDLDATRVSFRWQTDPGKLLVRIVAKVIDMPKEHSKVMHIGFAGLAKHFAA